jgi:ATP-dependent helicase/nuclease subunit A
MAPARETSTARKSGGSQAPRLVIRASAGTGKTYQLSTRYIAQLLATTPDRILATTFTRKAAGEILERILLRLADAALDERQHAALSYAIGRPKLSRSACLELLTGLVRHLHRVRVSTLDSFFSRVAGSFALELGLPAGWRLLDEIEDDQLCARAIETVLSEGDRHDLVQLMHLLSKGDAHRSVTGLVRETVDELYAVFQETTAEAWRPIDGPQPLGTDALRDAIDALRAAPLPTDKVWSKARDNDVAAAEDGDWETFAGKGIATKVLDGDEKFNRKPIPEALRQVYVRLLQHAAAIECKVLSGQLQAAHDLLDRFDKVYRRLKQQSGGLTFDDIARRLAIEFAQQQPDGLAYRLDASLEHLLLDEFQDTSLVQWTVLEPLAKGVAAGDGSTFFCVGDVKQAIYGWRGGVAEIFDTVTSRLTGLSEEQLDESFRSSAPVIETVNEVFRPRTEFELLPDHEECFVEWVNAFPRHSTNRTGAPGYACLVAGPDAEAGENAKAAVYRGAALFLKELFPQLPPQATIGILARTNAAVGQIVHALRKEGLPASEEGGNPLTDSAAVQIVLSAMQLADHPGDTIALFHVKHSPLGPMLELSRDAGADDALAASEQIRRLLQMRGYGRVVSDWAGALAPECNAREQDRLRQLTALADDYEPIATLRPADFARYVRARKVEDPRTARIRVMTVHKAKGLEFDVVLLPQLDEKLIKPPTFVAYREQGADAAVRICRYRNKSLQRLLPPDIRDAFRQTADRAVREALCVFYVSLTRAAQALYMFVPSATNPTQTFAGVLRQSLAPGKPCTANAVLYECGERNWHQQVPHIAASAEEGAAGPIQTPAPPLAGQRGRGRESRAPSQLKTQRTLSINDVLRSADSRALDRGHLLHAWFESLRWIDEAEPTDADLQRIAARLGCADDLVAKGRPEFRELLLADGLRNLLCRDAYRTGSRGLFQPGLCDADDVEISVETERRFDVLLDGALMSGSIDRLVLFRQSGRAVAADILDFKSDAVFGDARAATRRLVDLYSAQLDSYARAVSQIYELPREAIATRLVLLASREAVRVES